jgi:hypothetical protein
VLVVAVQETLEDYLRLAHNSIVSAPIAPVSGEWYSGGFDAIPTQHAREERTEPQPRPVPKLAIVLPFIEREMPQVVRLLEWMAKLSGQLDRTLYLLPFKGVGIAEVRALAAAAFGDVQVIPDAEGVEGCDWKSDNKVRDAAGPNSLFRQAAWFFELRRTLGPWLWLEPDCVPLVTGWADRIEAAYRASGKPFMGAVMRWQQNGSAPNEYLNGAGIYPQNSVTLAPGLVTRTMWEQHPDKEIAFDVAGGRAVFSKAQPTDLIQLAYRSDEIVEPNPDAVLFHGDRSGKLLEKLLSVPVLAEPSPVESVESRRLSSIAAKQNGEARESNEPETLACESSRSAVKVRLPSEHSRGVQKSTKRKRGDAKCAATVEPTPMHAGTMTGARLEEELTQQSNGAAQVQSFAAPSVGDEIRYHVGALLRLSTNANRRTRIIAELRKSKFIPRHR